MSIHPLIERAAQREVRQSRGFREAAAALTGEMLAEEFRKEVEAAPLRGAAGKRFLISHNTKLAESRRNGRDGEHAALALVDWCAENGALMLPDDENSFLPLHTQVPLRTAQADKKDPNDPNAGIGRLDIVGLGPGDRLAAVSVKYLAPDATRVGTGDTPLRALLEGLAHAAVAQANREALLGELGERVETPFADAPPALLIVGSPKYWELTRKREAQKGAAWIRELERLSAEIEDAMDVPVHFLSLRIQGELGWSYDTGAPKLDDRPRLLPAWEPGAGRVKPKARPRRRKESASVSDAPVEPDLTRPVRNYAIHEAYAAGDRIDHPTLGLGVVQGGAGPNKIRVLFDEKKSTLIHDRAMPGAGAVST